MREIVQIGLKVSRELPHKFPCKLRKYAEDGGKTYVGISRREKNRGMRWVERHRHNNLLWTFDCSENTMSATDNLVGLIAIHNMTL